MKRILAAAAAGLLTSLALAVPASAVNAWETDYASGTGPSTFDGCSSESDVNGIVLASACFKSSGDILGVEDQHADGHSAAFLWDNYVDGVHYRHGACVEKRGNDTYGACNKNFTEGSVIRFRACTWDARTDQPVSCGNLVSKTA